MNKITPADVIRDEWRVNEANRRLGIINAVRALMFPPDSSEPAISERKACKKLGISQATFSRWRRAYDADGFNGLLPKTDECGNKSVLQRLQESLGREVVETVIQEVQGKHLDTESNTAAWRLFAHSDRCPEPLAGIILDPNKSSKHAIPPSLRQATKITEPVKHAHRGRRSLDLNGIWIPRTIDILPGDIFTSDDTTPIFAWWVPWIESAEYPFGVKLLQGQFLPVMDVASQAIVCFVLIARESSSYRAADIWHLFGHTFDTVGLPRLGWQLERGSWEATIIRGQDVQYQDGELTHSRRVGGLRQLPANITQWHREKFGKEVMDCFPKTLQTWTSYLPKSKSIEAFFNRSQTLEGTLWGALGRDQMRRPFEKTKKLYEACKRPGSKIDPREHFLSHTEIVKRISGIFEYLNAEPMEGEVFNGVPRLKFDQAVREFPLFRLPDDQRWLYRRNWKVVTITSGWARVRLTHEVTGQRYSLFYCNPEVFAPIEGEQVVVYYDRENFEQPAQIVSVRTGEYLCDADYFERRGSFLEGDMSGHDIRKAWRNAVLSTYGTIISHAPSRQLPQEIADRRAQPAEPVASPAIVQRDNRPPATPEAPRIKLTATPEEFSQRATTFSRQAARLRQLEEQIK